jgi:hypothetical protein
LGSPIQQSVTPEGNTSGAGPGIAFAFSGKDVAISLRACFSGPFELPDGYEAASPAYLIQMTGPVMLKTNVTLQIEHFASLQSEEDCEVMSFLSASATPQYRFSEPVYVFKEIEGAKGIFKPSSQFGEIETDHFSFIITAWLKRRRRRLQRGNRI